ncbi:MAG: hypothetical protein ACPGXK_04465 [Phycisphaerae bacterium]
MKVQGKAIGVWALSLIGVQLASAATIDIIPVASDCGGQINGNEIVVTPGCNVELEVWISGFAPDSVAAYQTTIECSSLESDVAGKVFVSNVDGTIGACSFGNGDCSGVDQNNPRFLLANAASTLPACSLVNTCPSGDPGEFACGTVAIFGDSGADDGMPYYASTWGVTVGGDFAGTAQVSVQTDPNNSFIKNPMARDVPINTINPAIITVPVGRCCGNITTPFCQDNVPMSDCMAQGGTFDSGEACTGMDVDPADGLDDACVSCETDEQCNDGNACTNDSCTPNGCVNTDTTPAGQCCNPANGALTSIDDGDDCTEDVCDSVTGQVSHMPVPGGSCNDGNGCTFDDTCDDAGNCVGTDTNSTACNTIDDCPDGSQSCQNGFCVCTLTTPLNLVFADGVWDDPTCFSDARPITLEVQMGGGSECVTGGQYLIEYDPTCLEFEGLQQSDAFSLLIFEEHDAEAGTIFVAFGILPGDDCTQGPEVISTISFRKLPSCDGCNVRFNSVNPQNTILANDNGNSVPLELNESGFVRGIGIPTINAPTRDFEVRPACESLFAYVSWDDITGKDTCDPDPLEVVCTGEHDRGVDISDLVDNGGYFPQGISTITCETENSCGVSTSTSWRVIVSDRHALDVDIQLEPIVIGDPMTRCITFAFYSDCVQAPSIYTVNLEFENKFGVPGHWGGILDVPKGQYACLTAKDPLHTLRAVSDIDCVGDVLRADFKGDPVFDGNWLPQGNLDCWKPDGNGDIIDILDFGMFVIQYLEMLDPSAPCGSDGPHSDINGDGIVDGADFAFISRNFLEDSKNSCCEEPGSTATAGANQPIVSITHDELRRRGMPELVEADLNGDGLLDMADMRSFVGGTKRSRSSLGR